MIGFGRQSNSAPFGANPPTRVFVPKPAAAPSYVKEGDDWDDEEEDAPISIIKPAPTKRKVLPGARLLRRMAKQRAAAKEAESAMSKLSL